MSSGDGQIIVFTLATSFFAVALSLPFATFLAWLLARKNWLGKSIVETLATLPLVMPPVATGLVLLKLLASAVPSAHGFPKISALRSSSRRKPSSSPSQ